MGGRKHVIHATLTETYPNTPPVWFSESEDPKVSEAVSRLASTSGLDNHMLNQIRLLLTSLCDLFSISSKNTCYCFAVKLGVSSSFSHLTSNPDII